MPSAGPVFKPGPSGKPSAAHTTMAGAHQALAASKKKKQVTRNKAIAAGHAVAGNRKTAGGKPSTTKHVVSGAASGASTGAMIGSVVPGIGTAVGAAVGGVAGAGAGARAGHKAKKAYAAENRQGGYKQLLIAEFVICLVITALSPLTDKHKEDSPATVMKRYTAVAALFLILGLVSSGGRSAAKMASAFGGIATAVLLLSERNVLMVLAKKFSTPGVAGPAGPGPTASQLEENVRQPNLGPAAGVPDPGIRPSLPLADRTTITVRRNRLSPTGGEGVMV